MSLDAGGGAGELLPPGWSIAWGDRPGALKLSARALQVESVARAVASGAIAPPQRPATIALEPWPVFDDLVGLHLLTLRARGEEPRPSWEQLVAYAEGSRAGFCLDRLAPDRAPWAVYQTLAHRHLERATPHREQFLADALALCALLLEGADHGKILVQDDLLGAAPRFNVDVAATARDRELYAEDKARAKVFLARAPVEATGSVPRDVSLLALQRPASRLFKLWARSDPDAPGGNGFPLLLVEDDKAQIALSADPAKNLKVGFLASALSERERAAGHAEPQWYAGARHDGTLCAAPLSGSKLSLDDVLAALHKPLRLRRPTPKWLPRAAAASAAAAVAVVAVLIAAHGGGRRTPAEPVRLPSQNVERDLKAFRQRWAPETYAVVVGLCGYAPEKDQPAVDGCVDARALQKVLVERVGMDPGHIQLIVNDGEPDAKLGRQAVRFEETVTEAIQDVQRRHHEQSTLVFFYAGHGANDRNGYPHLVPPQSYPHEVEKGLSVSKLRELLWPRGPHVPHVLAVLDACHAGPASLKEPDQQLALTRDWDKESFAIISGAGANEKAVQFDHGVLTGALLRALGGDALQPGGYFTEDSIWASLSHGVEASVAAFGLTQKPRYERAGQGQVTLPFKAPARAGVATRGADERFNVNPRLDTPELQGGHIKPGTTLFVQARLPPCERQPGKDDCVEVKVPASASGRYPISVDLAARGTVIKRVEPEQLLLLGDDAGAVDFWVSVPPDAGKDAKTLTLIATYHYDAKLIARAVRTIPLAVPGAPREEKRALAQAVRYVPDDRESDPDLRIAVTAGESRLLIETEEHGQKRREQVWWDPDANGARNRIDRDLSSLARTAPSDAAVERALAVGTELFNALPETVQSRLRHFEAQFPNGTIRVETSDPLIPFELIAVPDAHGAKHLLGMQHAINRWEILDRVPPVPPSRIDVQALTLLAPDYDARLQTDPGETTYLLGDQVHAVLRKDPEEIKATLQHLPAGIVHFRGHGELEGTYQRLLLTAGGGVDLKDFYGWLAGQSGPVASAEGSILFFNACNLGRAFLDHDGMRGFGPAAIRAGASGFIGGLYALGDKTSGTFATAFYKLAADEMRLAEALRSVRAQFQETKDPTYLAYVYYGDADVTLKLNSKKEGTP